MYRISFKKNSFLRISIKKGLVLQMGNLTRMRNNHSL